MARPGATIALAKFAPFAPTPTHHAVPVLFVLLPPPQDIEPLLAAAADASALQLRRYPVAADAGHLRSLVRAGRDPQATSWRRGALLAIAAGAVLGGVTNGVLAGAFGMLGGLLEIAIPLGLGVGAFLGGFTAAMTGTEVPRDELRPLLARARAGDQLLQWSARERADLAALASWCDQRRLAHTLIDA